MTYSPIIKICGIKTAPMLEATIKASADMVGFVHFANSPRHLELEAINQLISIANKRIKTVVLLVNPNDGLLEKVASLKPDYIQLHGNESIKEIIRIREKYNIKIIKALPIANKRDLEIVADYSKIADLIILDAKPPKGADNPGGLGVSFNWNLLKNLDGNIKYLLSGGLNINNVTKAVLSTQPYGLDVSSGVEITRGEKDATMIEVFINNARLGKGIK